MNKISLNIPCSICKKKIYLGQETAHTNKGVYHLKCYIKKNKSEETK